MSTSRMSTSGRMHDDGPRAAGHCSGRVTATPTGGGSTVTGRTGAPGGGAAGRTGAPATGRAGGVAAAATTTIFPPTTENTTTTRRATAAGRVTTTAAVPSSQAQIGSFRTTTHCHKQDYTVHFIPPKQKGPGCWRRCAPLTHKWHFFSEP